MIAAVADLRREYFSTIELIAFSYAISGCAFSTSEIQSDRKPRYRLARRPKKPVPAISFPLCPRLADNGRRGRVDFRLEARGSRLVAVSS
jgi:hypothetical protein